MKTNQARAIYYAKQKRKYADYEQRIKAQGLTAEFEQFKANYKGFYKNKVYYYFFKKLEA